ncbi:MAG TPA: oxidoreductase [Acidimicrobiales bacterium]|nr:oxidoreductase [Acidimicrobiales bacterium]
MQGVAIVTGANSGIGLETASALAAAGATTVLACRNDERAAAARAEIVRRHPGADVELLRLDLGSLAQVAEAAAEARDRFEAIHIVVNNAGLITRSRTETVDGFETTFGVNHLGHFAWTARLLPAVLAAGGRVVNVSSLAHLPAEMDWDDLMGERRFKPVAAYRRSKLANLLHTAELHRRLSSSDRPGASEVIAVAAHPGVAASSFWENGAGPRFRVVAKAADAVIACVFSTAAQGAMPIVHAASADGVEPGRCYGPHIVQRWGRPGLVEPSAKARDAEAARRLWKVSEELTGVAPDI